MTLTLSFSWTSTWTATWTWTENFDDRNGVLGATVVARWSIGATCCRFNGSTCQRAIEFLALVGDIVGDLPKGHADRADQLVRAAESVVRNIAEGAGRWSEADCAKHYKIARGSAMECAASLDVMRLRKAVVAMLTKML